MAHTDVTSRILAFIYNLISLYRLCGIVYIQKEWIDTQMAMFLRCRRYRPRHFSKRKQTFLVNPKQKFKHWNKVQRTIQLKEKVFFTLILTRKTNANVIREMTIFYVYANNNFYIYRFHRQQSRSKKKLYNAIVAVKS